MSLTMKQVLDGLGLMPFDEYVNCPKRLAWVKKMKAHSPYPQDINSRNRGYTTRMICNLLVYLSKQPEGKKIYISAHSPTYTKQLCSRAREYAERFGLDPRQIKPFFGDTNDFRFVKFLLFQDHYRPARIF